VFGAAMAGASNNNVRPLQKLVIEFPSTFLKDLKYVERHK